MGAAESTKTNATSDFILANANVYTETEHSDTVKDLILGDQKILVGKEKEVKSPNRI